MPRGASGTVQPGKWNGTNVISFVHAGSREELETLSFSGEPWCSYKLSVSGSLSHSLLSFSQVTLCFLSGISLAIRLSRSSDKCVF